MFGQLTSIFIKLVVLMSFCFLSFSSQVKSEVIVSQYLDEKTNLSIDQIIASPPDFKVLDDPLNINHAFNAANLWIKIDLSQQNKPETFIIENAHLDTIFCYYSRKQNIINSVKTGDLFPFNTRPIPSNYFIFDIPDDASAIYLKINTQGALNVPIHFFNNNQIISYLIKENSITLVYFGVALVILILNLLLYIRLKESLYFYYSLSVLAAAVIIATNEGYMFKWFWPNTPIINNYIIALYASNAFLLLFSEKFLNLKKNSKVLLIIYRVLYLMLVGLVMMNLAGYYNIAIFLINLIVFYSTFLFLISGIYVYRKNRDLSVIYYLVGWGLYAIMAIIFTLSLFNLVPLTLMSMKAIQIGGSMEMIILFLAIVNKIEVLKKEKGLANQRVIDLLIKQEEYLQSQNRVLEEGVQNKTRELNKQKEKVQLQNVRLRKSREELREKNKKLEEALSSLKETQTQLVNAEKLAVLGQLTAGISHELNNPINFIKSGLEGIKSGMSNLTQVFQMYEDINSHNFEERLAAIDKRKQEIKYSEVLNLIIKVPDHINIGVSRATDLVKELRTYVHKDTEKEPVDICKSIDSSLILLYNEYKYNIVLEKIYNDIPKVKCYPGKINQVFVNILSNSIDAIKEKNKELPADTNENKIIITTEKVIKNEDEYALITIKDNGIGMQPETQKNLFIPFQKNKARGHGLGLGLFISDSIIKDHSGFIECQSEYLKGTSFKIFLPLTT